MRCVIKGRIKKSQKRIFFSTLFEISEVEKDRVANYRLTELWDTFAC